jgi:hypothetical protein
VREEEVVLPYVLVVAGGVLSEAGAGAREPVGHEVPARDELVHEVGRPTQEAEVVIGAQLEVLALLHEIFARARHEKRCRHGLARARRGVGHDVSVRRVELHVVLLGNGTDRLLENGLGRHVGYPPPAEVHARGVLLERLDICLSAASWHGGRSFLACAPATDNAAR